MIFKKIYNGHDKVNNGVNQNKKNVKYFFKSVQKYYAAKKKKPLKTQFLINPT